MIEIRLARPADIPELRRVAIDTQIATFGPQNAPEIMEAFLAESYSVACFEQELLETNNPYYLAWDGQQLAGFIRLRSTDEVAHLLGDRTIEIQRLYVDVNHQGKKVGAALMTFALEYARTRALEWTWLGVWEKNLRAQEFYARWGFERFSEHIFMMGPDPQTDWLLRFRL
jgi:ribosomal protein S18 acetylase RimI-like enzyme